MSLASHHRPLDWRDVVGQNAIVKSFHASLDKGDQHAYLLIGPSGVGKTTLARLAAADLAATRLDIDAAKYTGVDDMREVSDRLQTRPLDDKPLAIVVDECHRLSGNAWDCLLNVTEEPPEWAYWFLCTTNPSKVPKTIRTRCASYHLKELGDADLVALCEDVAKSEKLKISRDVIDVCVRQANGSARQALTNMEVCRGAANRREAAELLFTMAGVENDPAVDLCRMIANGRTTWPDAMKTVEKANGLPPESIRIQVFNYLGACLRNAKNDKAAIAFLHRMNAFSQPYSPEEGQAALARSIGIALLTLP